MSSHKCILNPWTVGLSIQQLKELLPPVGLIHIKNQDGSYSPISMVHVDGNDVILEAGKQLK